MLSNRAKMYTCSIIAICSFALCSLAEDKVAPPAKCDNKCRERKYMKFSLAPDYREYLYPDCFGCTQAAGSCQVLPTDSPNRSCQANGEIDNPFYRLQETPLVCPPAVNGYIEITNGIRINNTLHLWIYHKCIDE